MKIIAFNSSHILGAVAQTLDYLLLWHNLCYTLCTEIFDYYSINVLYNAQELIPKIEIILNKKMSYGRIDDSFSEIDADLLKLSQSSSNNEKLYIFRYPKIVCFESNSCEIEWLYV